MTNLRWLVLMIQSTPSIYLIKGMNVAIQNDIVEVSIEHTAERMSNGYIWEIVCI
jgi:hypothetical protein